MNPEKSITGSKEILSSTTITNTDINQVSNKHMISEGSCDTNDAENSALITILMFFCILIT